ncbi:MAG: hypothetical protein IPG64_09555 [Haliea sp.]|nr:hypothetical protein [Haliea sp.]
MDSGSVNNGTRYGLLLLCAVLFPLALLAGFNFIIDPYQLLGAPAIDGVNAKKTVLFSKLGLTKPYAFYGSDHTSLILGSSRAGAAIDPAHPTLADASFYNFATPGARPRQDFEKLRAAIATRAIHKVIYSVDFFTFNSFNSLPEDYAAEVSKRLSKHSSLGQPSLFATSAARLRHSALVLHCTARQHSYGTSTAGVQFKCAHLCNCVRQWSVGDALWEGTVANTVRLQNGTVVFAVQLVLPLKIVIFHSAEGTQTTVRHWEDFAALLRLAHDNNIELTVVILPVHARLLEILDYAGLWPYFEFWKRQLVAINEQTASAVDRSPFPIWDFSGYYAVATEPVSAEMNAKPLQWMYDSAHTTVNTGEPYS